MATCQKKGEIYDMKRSGATSLITAILEHVESLGESAPLCAKELLHLGSRAAVDQALSRLARRGRLLRLSHGLYARPLETRFGRRPPSPFEVVAGLSRLTGETIAEHGAVAANRLGLTQQVPVRQVFLTTGRSRRLRLGAQAVEIRHAPAWQLVLAGRPAGEAIRALAWLGPERARQALGGLRARLPAEELAQLTSARPRLPGWLAQGISEAITGA